MKLKFATLACLCACACAQPGPRTELLWPEGAPGAVGSEDVDKPSLTSYLPDPAAAAGTAIVVCPGGGYRNLAMDHEGKQVAEWLNSLGVAAFVLKYRLGPRYHHPAMMQDVQRAIQMVRKRAPELKVAPDRVGVMGFSAGGHLASTAATHFAKDGDGVSSRPDFAILCYPVITMKESFVHKGSRENLLGKNPDPKLMNELSNETQVTAETPPTFLFHTSDDPGVPVENSVYFYLALRKAGVPAEMHLFEHGRHGVGLAQSDPALKIWPSLLENWLRARNLIRRKTS
jgi:acetyl esterase/lipase